MRDIAQGPRARHHAGRARDCCVARLGADRALSRGEIEKLALYAPARPRSTSSDVEAIVGDASELALDRIAQCGGVGRRGAAVAEFARASPPAKARR